MFVVICTCLALIGTTTLLHYEVLRGLHAALPRLRIPSRTKLLVTIFTVFFAHALQIALYGTALYVLVHYVHVGSLHTRGGSDIANTFYFSAETYTSLGFGDLVPVGPVRLLAGTEGLNGLLLVGWSASYAYIAMERFWRMGFEIERRDAENAPAVSSYPVRVKAPGSVAPGHVLRRRCSGRIPRRSGVVSRAGSPPQ